MKSPLITPARDDSPHLTTAATPNKIKNKHSYWLQITCLTIGMLTLGFLTAGPAILGMEALLPKVVSALNWFIGSVLHLPALAVIPPVPAIAISVTVYVIVACLTILWAYLYGEPIFKEMSHGARNNPREAKRTEKTLDTFFEKMYKQFEQWKTSASAKQALSRTLNVQEQVDVWKATQHHQVSVAKLIAVEWLKVKHAKAQAKSKNGTKQSNKATHYEAILQQATVDTSRSCVHTLIDTWIETPQHPGNTGAQHIKTHLQTLPPFQRTLQGTLLHCGIPPRLLLPSEIQHIYQGLVAEEQLQQIDSTRQRNEAFAALCKDPREIVKAKETVTLTDEDPDTLPNLAAKVAIHYWELAGKWVQHHKAASNLLPTKQMDETHKYIYRELMTGLVNILYRQTPEFSPETKWIKKVINWLGWVLNPAINALGLIVGTYGLFLLIPMPAAVQIPIIALAGLLGFLAAAFRTRKSAVGLYGGFFEWRRKASMQKGTFLENKEPTAFTTKALLVGALAFSIAITVFNWNATGMAILAMQNFAYYLANPGALTPALVHNFAALSPLVQAGCIVGGLSTFIFVLTFMADGVVNRTKYPWNKVVLPISIIATAGNSVFLAYNVYMASGSLLAGGVIFVVAICLTMNLFKLASDSIQKKFDPHPLRPQYVPCVTQDLSSMGLGTKPELQKGAGSGLSIGRSDGREASGTFAGGGGDGGEASVNAAMDPNSCIFDTKPL